MNSEYLAVGVINENYFSVKWEKVHRPSHRTYIVNLLHQITECFIPRYWKPESAANKGKKVHINTYLNTILPFFASFIGATYMINTATIRAEPRTRRRSYTPKHYIVSDHRWIPASAVF